LHFPVTPAAGSEELMTVTEEKDSTIARVRSVDPSSTTVMAKSTPCWLTRDSRQAPIDSCSLRAGTMIWTHRIS
jgi:hypothetical protein